MCFGFQSSHPLPITPDFGRVKTAVFGTAESGVYGAHRRQVFGAAAKGVAVLAIDVARHHNVTYRHWGKSLIESGFCVNFRIGPRKRRSVSHYPAPTRS